MNAPVTRTAAATSLGRMKASLAILLLFSLISLCAEQVPSAAQLRAAADYSKAKAGLTMVVWQNGMEIFSESQNSGSLAQYYELASGTKSFSGVMAAAAVADGFLGFDELAADTLTEWKADARKSRITVRMLLHLTSGLEQSGQLTTPTYAEAVAKAAATEPGTVFVYDPVHFQAFGELIRRKLATRGGGSPVDYLKSRVLNRIGLQVGNWRLGNDGNPLLPAGAQLRAQEWIKFGEFMRNEGAWQGEQIIPASLLREIKQPGLVLPAYGMTWWLNQPVTPEVLAANVVPEALSKGLVSSVASVKLHMAAGLGDQRLYIVPELGLVVARQAPLTNISGYSDAAFLALLLPATAPSTLVNVSTRGRVGSGEDSLIGGFVISGTRAKTVLVRAVGPTLANFGIGAPLADPQLRIADVQGRTIKVNDNWGAALEAASFPSAFTATGAFTLLSGSKDAASLITLAPGAYTALMSPATGEDGVGLVEVYELPDSFTY